MPNRLLPGQDWTGAHATPAHPHPPPPPPRPSPGFARSDTTPRWRQASCDLCGAGRSSAMGSEGATSDAVCVSCAAGTYGGLRLPCVPCSTGTWSTGSANAACTSCSSNQYLDVTSTGANCAGGDATACPTDVDHSAHCKYCDAGMGPASVYGAWEVESVQCLSCSAPTNGQTFYAWQTVTGGAANDGCQLCPHFHEFNASSIALYAADVNAATKDWSSHCSRACPEGEMKSELYGVCVSLPKPLTALPYVAGKEQRVISECEAGHVWNSRTSQCERCPASLYALPGTTSCTPCEAGTTSSAGASGCVAQTAAPACSASEVLAPRINDYDCLLRQMTTGNFPSCDSLMNALWANSMLPAYATGLKRLCSKTIHNHASYYDPDTDYYYGGYYDVFRDPGNGDWISRSTVLRKLAAEAHAEWGLDDDHTLDFWLYMQGIAPIESGYVGPLNTGCATMDGLRASGAGFNYIAQQMATAQAEGETCAASRCADPRFTKDWCAAFSHRGCSLASTTYPLQPVPRKVTPCTTYMPAGAPTPSSQWRVPSSAAVSAGVHMPLPMHAHAHAHAHAHVVGVRVWCANACEYVARMDGCPLTYAVSRRAGVPAATITCGAATTPVLSAGGAALPISWEFSKPVQPRSMLARAAPLE